jgi:hypothetical protein
MMTFREGELVGVPCVVQRGPFPDENLVMVETKEGTISGFVKQANLKVSDGERGLVKGTVVATERDHVTVRLFGSFFTTALGVADVRPNGLERLAAARSKMTQKHKPIPFNEVARRLLNTPPTPATGKAKRKRAKSKK